MVIKDMPAKCTVTVHPVASVKDPAALCKIALDVFQGQTVSLFLGIVEGQTELTVVGYPQTDHQAKLDLLIKACSAEVRPNYVWQYQPPA